MSDLSLGAKLSGQYRLQVFGGDGKLKTDTGFFRNLLTDGFFDWWCAGSGAISSAFSNCGVGSGTATPAFTDTAITPVGTRTSTTVISTPVLSGQLVTQTSQYRFAVSQVVGTIAEVGLFTASSGGVLTSRTLIKDATTGVPTTITLLTGDTLYVTYKMEITVPSADVTGVVSVSGVDYNYVVRPALIGSGLTASNSNSAWVALSGSYIVSGSGGVGVCSALSSQTLGAQTSSPGGTTFPATSRTYSTYVAGSKSRRVTYSWAVADGNASGGIGSLQIGNLVSGGWQISFAAVSGGGRIPKDGTKVFTIPVTFTWSR